MNKALIKTISFFLIMGLTSCSYGPIFSEKKLNFEVGEIIFTGEPDVNKYIDDRLKLIQKKQDVKTKKYDLNIRSEKKKNIISKNSKGDPLKFEMVISVAYKVTSAETLYLKKEIEKINIYNNDSDLFELEQTEKIILENISGNISDIIISSIINLDDN